ncbi:MAG TPA: hydrogenase expression/formation protein HypE [candidate division WOR-3 bacterium]|uniref:Hydrogenase expression/formation protein HypE n=1 Tax=candidate division WOR-3 bacterium TaxID=2052148 RepID=A0A9C9EKB3_UNCW3|nr:hydrogenase expression/formation protein HypE [candidate division WOR-3 bacterium]
MTEKNIRMSHGAGGLSSSRLIKKIILKYFTHRTLKKLEDSAELKIKENNLAFTTDSYVIQPLFFPGGDIGKLAIYGTVNDLAMKGAVPGFIAFSMIIEEGFPIKDLKRILKSAAAAARKARVAVVCGDTKVVEKGKADKIFITTSGVGVIKIPLSKDKIKPGDLVLVSGTVGDHGIAVMNERLNLGLRSNIKSDCAPLNLLTRNLTGFKGELRCMRDPTRGGVVSVLNEIIDDTELGIVLDEKKIPIKKEVIGVSEILGVDPLYIANEGKLIAVVSKKAGGRLLKKLRAHPLGKNAAIIGEVVDEPPGVWLKTRIGGIHPLLQTEAEGLPRIC